MELEGVEGRFGGAAELLLVLHGHSVASSLRHSSSAGAPGGLRRPLVAIQVPLAQFSAILQRSCRGFTAAPS
jgi:hypothetical protein